ncbi:MAG: twitch domain-containing radical SAM protein, partial [Bacteriovoracaceae bacterium]
EKGLPSFRQGGDAWENYFRPFSERMPDPSLSHFPNNLDIQLDNYCDLKCLYCNEEFSSQWQNEKLRFGEQISTRLSTVNPELERNFFRWFETVKDHLERIAFLGGEPLISPIFYDYFEKILASYQGQFPKNLKFNIITNLNTPTATFDRLRTLLETHGKTVKFQINISMESWGVRAELIRSGVDYKRFLSNFEKLAEMDHNISLLTITSLNVLCISSLYQYLRFVIDLEQRTGRKIPIHSNLIHFPDWLSIELTHPDFYEKYISDCIKLIEHIPHHRYYLDFLKSLKDQFRFGLHPESVRLQKRFIHEMKILSERRNVSYQKVFKEYDYLWTASSEA